VEYRILGPLEVVGADAPIPIPAGKTRALLELLLLSANKIVPTGRLVDALWGDDPPPSAEHAIEVYVSNLRRAVGPDAISTGPGGYSVHVGADQLDLDRFERLTAEARIARDQHDPAKAVGLFRHAEGLWRGSALAELSPTPVARGEVVRLEELRIAATEQRLDTMLAMGNHLELIPELEALVAAHPYRERLRAQQMLGLYRAGRQADALAAYHQARAILADALGIEPGEELQALQLAILRQDASLAASPPPTIEQARPRSVASRWPRTALVIAAVIAAVLVTAGLIWSTGTRPTAPLEGEDQRLFQQLPSAVRAVPSGCRPVSVADGSLSGVTSLHCTLPFGAEADEVWFDRFATQAALEVAFGRLVAEVGSTSDDCEKGPWPAIQRWDVPAVHQGMLLCHAEGGPALFAWTYESERLLARASRADGNLAALYVWWDATALFLREGDAPRS
jgi:DNA-binding SARP family transcriptional activator